MMGEVRTAWDDDGEASGEGTQARVLAFGAFVRETPFPTALLDANLKLVAVSREWTAQAIAPDLVLGADASGVVEPNDRAALLACAQEGVDFSRYLNAVAEDGSQRYWRTEFGACRREDGSVYAVMVTARDVTGYAESVLRAERDEQRLRMALELDDLLVREYDLRTGEIFFSDTAPGLRKWCVFRDDPLEIVHPDDRSNAPM